MYNFVGSNAIDTSCRLSRIFTLALSPNNTPRYQAKKHLLRSGSLPNIRYAYSSFSLLADFGVCIQYHEGLELKKEVGTHEYMAPEMVDENGVYSPAVDVWGMGCVLYELCTLSPTPAFSPYYSKTLTSADIMKQITDTKVITFIMY